MPNTSRALLQQFTIKGIDFELEAARGRVDYLESLRRRINGGTSQTAAATTTRTERAMQTPRTATRRSRRPMSATARKMVSARMKKYWAERRKAKSQEKT